jgi:hypothetical protein
MLKGAQSGDHTLTNRFGAINHPSYCLLPNAFILLTPPTDLFYYLSNRA